MKLTPALSCPLLFFLTATACSGSDARAAGDPPLGVPGSLALDEIRTMVAEPALHTAFVPEAPLGIGANLAALIPAHNPLTRAKVELGCQLFFDARLSRDGTRACATCHHPSLAWADARTVSGASTTRAGARNAPSLQNRILGTTQYRDGRAPSLEAQALAALSNPFELGFSAEEAAQRLNEIEGYRLQFEAIFGGPATPERVSKAIAAFERTLLSGESPYDVHERARPFLESETGDGSDPRYLARRLEALTATEKLPLGEAAQRGRELFFGRAKCSACHSGPDLSDERFHNLGVGMERKAPDLGRFAVTQAEPDKGAFRTPSLRHVARTAPYMHDGSSTTLRQAVEHHARGGTKNPWLSNELTALALSEQETLDLVAFLEEGLTGQATLVNIPRLP